MEEREAAPPPARGSIGPQRTLRRLRAPLASADLYTFPVIYRGRPCLLANVRFLRSSGHYFRAIQALFREGARVRYLCDADDERTSGARSEGPSALVLATLGRKVLASRAGAVLLLFARSAILELPAPTRPTVASLTNPAQVSCLGKTHVWLIRQDTDVLPIPCSSSPAADLHSERIWSRSRILDYATITPYTRRH